METSQDVTRSDWEWLDMFYKSAKDVGEIVVDDFATIKRRLIDKNKEALKKDSGLNQWLAKNVVKNFVQSITKSIENLGELQLDIIKELRHRYPTIDGDWLSENCGVVSSSVKSPSGSSSFNGNKNPGDTAVEIADGDREPSNAVENETNSAKDRLTIVAEEEISSEDEDKEVHNRVKKSAVADNVVEKTRSKRIAQKSTIRVVSEGAGAASTDSDDRELSNAVENGKNGAKDALSTVAEEKISSEDEDKEIDNRVEKSAVADNVIPKTRSKRIAQKGTIRVDSEDAGAASTEDNEGGSRSTERTTRSCRRQLDSTRARSETLELSKVQVQDEAPNCKSQDEDMLSDPDIVPASPLSAAEMDSTIPPRNIDEDQDSDSTTPADKETNTLNKAPDIEDEDMLPAPDEINSSKDCAVEVSEESPVASTSTKSKSVSIRKSLDKESVKAKKLVLMSDSSDDDDDFKPTQRRKPVKSSSEKAEKSENKKSNEESAKKEKPSPRSKKLTKATDANGDIEKPTKSKENAKPRKARRKVDPDYWKNHDIKDDIKAQSLDKTKVRLERLDKTMEEELAVSGRIYIAPNSESESEKADKRISKALKNFDKFDPLVKGEEKDRKNAAKKGGRTLRNQKGKTADSKYGLDALSDSEENSSDGGSVKIAPSKSKKITKVSSSDEDLSSLSNNDDDDEAAKNNVLDDSDEEGASSKGKKEKKENTEKNAKDSKDPKKRYYTPAVCRLDLSDSDDEKEKKGKQSKKSKPKEETAKKSKKFSEEDSSDEFIPPVKRRLRGKKKVSSGTEDISSGDMSEESDDVDSDSDASDKKKSSRRKKRQKKSSSEDEKPSKKKKRRRIKVADSDASENSTKQKGSDSDIQEIEVDKDGKEVDSPSKGRKKIRKLLSKKDLEKTTREAEKEEEERKRRVMEKQKLVIFNCQLIEAKEAEADADKDVVLESLVLDFDPKTKEPTVSSDTSVVCKLKPHQANGVKFIYDCTIESTEEISKDKPGGGCIIAHCMGLGKTLTTITFVHSALTNPVLKSKLKTALIVCPLNTVTNWYNECKSWLSDANERVNIHKLWDQKNYKDRAAALSTFMRRGGIGIIHYDSFRTLSDMKGQKKVSPKLKDQIRENLLDPGPDIVVCDEGHVLKNDKSKLSIALNKIRTRRRIVLTGTPLQNNLAEYHTMMSFVKPNLLGTLKEFQNRFINPIKNGQHADSDDYDVKLMKRRAHVLHKLLDGCVQRLDFNVLAPYLPPKFEYVVHIKMCPTQVELYKHYLKNLMDTTDVNHRHRTLLKNYAYLQKIWTHPVILTHIKQKKGDGDDSESEGSIKDFICDSDDDTTPSSESVSGSDNDWVDQHNKKMKKKKEAAKAKAEEVPEPDPLAIQDELTNVDLPLDWYLTYFESKSDMERTEHSGKLLVLMEIIKICESVGDKLLIFSQYLTSLNLIEDFLENWDREGKEKERKTGISFPQNLGLSTGRWRKDIEYYRIDGSTRTDIRQDQCDKFNSKTTSRAKLFLISTRAGGLGINLVGANRVVIFDASWNPSHDMQSVFRVYRFGQTKPCYIYRLLAEGTMEEKIYNRQVVKLSLSGRVVDEHQIERHFKFEDTNSLYLYEDPDEKKDRPIPPVPKDRLLADLLISQKDRIVTYLEHDTLLANKMDEGLTEEERKAAWDEYHNEKTMRAQQQPGMNVAPGDNTYLKIWQILKSRYNFPPDQLKHWSDQILIKINQLQIQLNYYNLHQHSLSPEEEQLRKKSIEELRAWISKALGTNNTNTNQPHTSASSSFHQQGINPAVQYVPTAQVRPQLAFQPMYPNPNLQGLPQMDMSTNILGQQLVRPPVAAPPPAISQSMQSALSKVAGSRTWNATNLNPRDPNREN